GPAITAIGNGLGQIAVALGKLLEAAASPNGIKVLAGIFTVTAKVITGLAAVVAWVSTHWSTIGPLLAAPFKFAFDLWKAGFTFGVTVVRVFLDVSQGHWRKAWQDIKKAGVTIWHDIRDAAVVAWHAILIAIGGQLDRLRHNIAVAFDNVRHGVATIWDLIWRNTVGRLQRGVADINRFLGRLPGDI